MAELYQEQYCKKHDQHYGAHLHECPICAGEKLDGYMLKKDKNEAS